MVNFRFHLISLIAVFCALGLGILVGSTVVDQSIVDRLDREIRTARRDTAAVKTENERLADAAARGEEFARRSAAYTLGDRLAGVPVVVVAEAGVDGRVPSELVAALRSAGAEVPGTIWLEGAWRLDGDDEVAALEALTGAEGTNAAVRSAAIDALAARLASGGAAGARTALLDRLRADGFVRFAEGDAAAFAAFPRGRARVVLVTGTDSRLAGTDVLPDLARSLAGAGAPVVAAEAYDDHGGVAPVPERGSALAPIRGDRTLAARVSTVDDADLAPGVVTTVLAVSAPSTVGHYGYGAGARAPLPEPAASPAP